MSHCNDCRRSLCLPCVRRLDINGWDDLRVDDLQSHRKPK